MGGCRRWRPGSSGRMRLPDRSTFTLVLRKEAGGQQVRTKRRLVIPLPAVSGLKGLLEVRVLHHGSAVRAASGGSRGRAAPIGRGPSGTTPGGSKL
eukprot:gene30657-biopygen31992